MPRGLGSAQPEIVPLHAGRRADSFRLHGACNGAGWCACAAWRVDTRDGWADRSAAENRAAREALFLAAGFVTVRADAVRSQLSPEL